MPVGELPAEKANKPKRKSDKFTGKPECCNDPLFVRRMCRRAEKQPNGFAYISSFSWRSVCKWNGNTPPMLTIAASETQHAQMSNRLSASAWWKVGPGNVLEGCVLARYRGGVQARVVAEREEVEAERLGQPQRTAVRNQYDHSFIHSLLTHSITRSLITLLSNSHVPTFAKMH